MDKSAIKILVLDDESFVLKLLGRMLSNMGYSQVTLCESGSLALQTLDAAENAFDLVLLDLNMPEMDGVEFVRHLVERRFGGTLVLVSGEDERVLKSVDQLVRAHKISLLGHMQKPVTPGVLDSLLGNWSPTPAVQSGQRAAKRMYSADEVRAAIVNRELVNYYQPKVAVATGKVVGAETLVRWRHPEDGMVFPDQFIGVAEANGLIDDLTREVLRGALAQIKAWENVGLPLRVAVNVSMDNLSSLGFADFVAEATTAAGVSPKDLVLEITESRLMEDLRAPLEILTRLRMKRFHLSIDDFGTGHSSLVQLRDIPFDELKIDQSFVHRAWCDPTIRAMFDGSLGMAKQLGMEIVAEGVEDEADWNFLRKTECHLAQGYFIARPMPAVDIPAWVKSWDEKMQKESSSKK